MPVTSDYQSFLALAWSWFIERGELLPGVPSNVAMAWQRCRQLGVDALMAHCRRLSREEIAARREASRMLIEVSCPFLKTLQQVIDDSAFVVGLADSEGVLLEVLGNKASAEQFCTGAVWTEQSTGNTAIVSALASGQPAQVVGYEHYCKAFHPWGCSAAPVLGPDGRVIGVLAVSGPVSGVHPHTLGMVVAAARAVEGQLAQHIATEQLRAQHRYQEAIIESITDGFLAIDQAGRITYLNAAGGMILGVDHKKVLGKFVGDIVDFKPVVLTVLETGQGFVDKEFMIKTRDGMKHFIKTAVPIRDESGRVVGVVDTFREIKRVRKMVNEMIGAQAKFTFDDILGTSRELMECVWLAKVAARSESTVLILGETGTGKELFAQAIHNASARREGPFVALNCASIPKELMESELFGYEGGAFTGAVQGGRPGKFELASGGTIFLDEIGDMPLDMQAKLLRVLQERRILRIGGSHYIDCDARVIAATNKDLAKLVEEGQFRRDLYYRLNVITIELPPLRCRGADIDLLLRYFVERVANRLGRRPCRFSEEAMHILRSYQWPGNVRELENFVERALSVADGQELGARDVLKHLPGCKGKGATTTNGFRLRDLEKEAISKAVKAAEGNISLAARLLGVSRNTLYNKMKKYSLTS